MRSKVAPSQFYGLYWAQVVEEQRKAAAFAAARAPPPTMGAAPAPGAPASDDGGWSIMGIRIY